MSSAVLELTFATRTTTPLEARSAYWDTPSGPPDSCAKPRTNAPTLVYRGYADPHWRGQACHLVGASCADERSVVMACGCRASVPWWTLEPLA